MSSSSVEYRLGDLLVHLGDYHSNGSYKKLKENVTLLDEPNYAVMIRTTNFENDDLTSNLIYVDEHAYNFLAKSKVEPNDIIMNKIANAGSCYFMPDLGVPVSLAMNLFQLRINTEIADPRYVYLYLKQNESYVKSFANGSVTKTITKDAVRNLRIKLPSRSKQVSIADIAFAFTKKIELNRRMNATLESLARAIFKSWFVDFDPVHVNAGLALTGQMPASSAIPTTHDPKVLELFPSTFEQTKAGKTPSGWSCVEVNEIATADKGLSYKGKFLSDDEGKHMVNLGCLEGNGRFKHSKLKSYTGDYKHRHVVNAGDLVLANTDMTQTRVVLGSPAFVPSIYGCDEMLFTHHVYAIRFKPGFEDWKTFVYFSFLQPRFREIAEGYATGTTVLALPKDGVHKYLLRMPSVEVRDLFNATVHPMLKKIEQFTQESSALSKLRDRVLPKLLTGELPVAKALNATEETLA